MGSIASGLFDLFSGDPALQQEKQLETLGTDQINTGQNLVTPAATYYENILSGDPSKIAQTLSPEISAGQQQVEQQALQGSQFGTRSGGTAAASRAAEDAERGNIINLVGGLQSSAASAAGNLGTEQESLGAGNVNDVAGMKTRRQQQVAGDVGNVVQGAADVAAGIMGGAGGAGGADPYATLYNAQHPDLNSIQTETPDLSGYTIS